MTSVTTVPLTTVAAYSFPWYSTSRSEARYATPKGDETGGDGDAPKPGELDPRQFRGEDVCENDRAGEHGSEDRASILSLHQLPPRMGVQFSVVRCCGSNWGDTDAQRVRK